MNTKYFALGALLLGWSWDLHSQTPTDHLMMKGNQICTALIYDAGSFNEYWEGASLRTNATISTVHRQMYMGMVTAGILDNLNVIVFLPYVKTESAEPNGGYYNGAKGLQDISIHAKYQVKALESEDHVVRIFGVVGIATPVSDYLSDYQPYSLGLGTQEVSSRAIVHYEWKKMLFVRANTAYLWRGYTHAERDFYYNDGAYYTSKMDVPSAMHYQLTLGSYFFDRDLRIEGTYSHLGSLSGDDIRAYNAPQPTNQVEVDQYTFFAQYFVPKVEGLGIIGSFSQVTSGRNVGKTTGMSIGINYFFDYRP